MATSKTLIVKPASQIIYDPINSKEIFFNFSPGNSFLNGRNSRLEYSLKFQGRGRVQPNPSAGANGLFKKFSIHDGANMVLMEEVNEYGVIQAQIMGFNSNQSLENTRSLFEGVVKTPVAGSSVFYDSGFLWRTNPVAVPLSPKTVSIVHKLDSGILNNLSVFPIVSTKGLKLTLTLENLNKSCMYQTGALGIEYANGYQTNNIKAIDDDNKAVAPGDTFIVDLKNVDSNPFDIGDYLYINTAVAGVETALGVITAFTINVGNLRISYIPNRDNGTALTNAYPIDSICYVKNNDRLNGIILDKVPPASSALALVPITYSLSNIQYSMDFIQPPVKYVEALQHKTNDKQGTFFDYATYSNHVVNNNSLSGLTSQIIPSNYTRAYSVFSVPVASVSSLLYDSYQGLVDNVQSYYYLLGDEQKPSRAVDLKRYSIGKVEPIHLALLEDSLTNASVPVKNLQNVPNRFMIGQAFSKYGMISNINNKTLSLNIEYDNALKLKTYYHYVKHVKRVIINKDGINVIH